MIEIGIVGAKNSGKTTLIEALIPLFCERGLKVATIKHTGHDHTFDSEGKDSFRHRQAGAELTVALSQTEMAIFTEPNEMYLSIAQEIIAKQFDLCLVEGDKRSGRPKALLTRNLDSIKRPIPGNIIVSYGPDPYSDSVPHLATDDPAGLVNFLYERFLAPEIKAVVHE